MYLRERITQESRAIAGCNANLLNGLHRAQSRRGSVQGEAGSLGGLPPASPQCAQEVMNRKSFNWLTGWIIVLSIFLSIFRSTAYAEPMVIIGLGTLSCAEFNEKTMPTGGYNQNNLSTAVFSWLQGYFSGLNTFSLMRFGRFSDVKSISADQQWEQIVGFCRQNPNRAIFDAAQEVLAALTKIEMCSSGGEAGQSSGLCL